MQHTAIRAFTKKRTETQQSTPLTRTIQTEAELNNVNGTANTQRKKRMITSSVATKRQRKGP